MSPVVAAFAVGMVAFAVIVTVGIWWRRRPMVEPVPVEVAAPAPPAPVERTRPTTNEIGDAIIQQIERRRRIAAIRPAVIVRLARRRIAQGTGDVSDDAETARHRPHRSAM